MRSGRLDGTEGSRTSAPDAADRPAAHTRRLVSSGVSGGSDGERGRWTAPAREHLPAVRDAKLRAELESWLELRARLM
ncbi:hypothetical protein OG413_21190 [Streptomyces sp. NBC_01433]|uniref:hypothetical protein n=1 Tax=Streptomyces sp. NBC_01433 TaxID=2903864 RepID=UPI002257539A|nr:hypothetical protein [Streptomyces sp. NBC_01433]MCX4677793.1 hypothetical protein [Streptomyces sp. NBC_01433]